MRGGSCSLLEFQGLRERIYWMWGFSGSSAGKEFPCNAGDPSSIPRSERYPGEGIPTPVFLGFPCGSVGKESACNAGHLGWIPGLGRSPRGGHGNPFQYSSLENLDGQRSQVGCSPWGGKESDTTEWLSAAQHSIYGMHYFLCLVDNRCSTI